jgi:hypothetical protein
MNYNTVWMITSVTKLVTEVLKKTENAGTYILVSGTVIVGYFTYKKMKELEKDIEALQFKVLYLEGKYGR